MIFYLLISFLCGLLMGYIWFYNQGYQDGTFCEHELMLQKYLMATRQNDKLWDKNLELMNIIKKHDRTIVSCWDDNLEWKDGQ